MVLWLLVTACGSGQQAGQGGFVKMDSAGFVLRGEPYFPLGVNYIANVRIGSTGLWATPSPDYASIGQDARIDPARDRAQLFEDMRLIRDMGFNSVRVVGLNEVVVEGDAVWYSMRNALGHDTLLPLEQVAERADYLDAVSTVLEACRAADLRVVLLVQLRPAAPITERLFARIADRFVADTIVMAYDLFNEPLYFDPEERSKQEVHALMTGWRKLFDRHAPHQLYTMGLTGIRETFEFDPNMLQVDFISYHPYEYEPDQVRNELRWYHDVVQVPWIIGETAIPADGDSVPYVEQADFAERTLRQARACGAIGYTWWQFQDVRWGTFHADYMGLLHREGTLKNSKGGSVAGGLKPVVEVFRSYDPFADAGPCLCLPNQANYSAGKASRVEGRLVDGQGRPIVHGTVIGWNEFWGSSYHTVSDSAGYFALEAPERIFHWMASASLHGMVRGDLEVRGYRTRSATMPTWRLGTLTLERLPFASGV